MNFIKKNWKGVLLCLMIAIPSWILGKFFPIVGGPVFAILLGMVITWRYEAAAKKQSYG